MHAKLAEAPISVALAAGNNVWRYYSGGLVTTSSGCPTQLDHAVVLVAFTPGQEVEVPAVPEQCRPKLKNEKKWCRDGSTAKGSECCTEAQPATTEM